jgi:hypothetical protein
MHIQVDGVMFQDLFKIWLMNFVFESQHRIHIEHVYVSDHDAICWEMIKWLVLLG